MRWWYGLAGFTALAVLITAANLWFWTAGGHMLPTYWKAWTGDGQSALTLAAFHSSTAGSLDDDGARAAFFWARRAARSGDPEALVALAQAYSAGLGVQQDKVQAVTLYRDAAEADDLEALYALGFLNLFGEIADRDPDAGERYWVRASDLGHLEAQAALGRLWIERPEKQDPARDLLRAAAKAGHPGAAADLSRLYSEGSGVLRDHSAAAYWRCRAEGGQGDEPAERCAAVHGEPPDLPGPEALP